MPSSKQGRQHLRSRYIQYLVYSPPLYGSSLYQIKSRTSIAKRPTSYLPTSYKAVFLHCWKQPSTSDRHLCLCCASCLHVTPFNCTRSSRHLLRCLPLDLLPSRGCHSVTLCVHRLSSNLATCPAHFHFCFSTNWTMSCTLVLFLISVYGILSFIFKFNIFLSMAL